MPGRKIIRQIARQVELTEMVVRAGPKQVELDEQKAPLGRWEARRGRRNSAAARVEAHDDGVGLPPESWSLALALSRSGVMNTARGSDRTLSRTKV